jgi:hypothetical protein
MKRLIGLVALGGAMLVGMAPRQADGQFSLSVGNPYGARSVTIGTGPGGVYVGPGYVYTYNSYYGAPYGAYNYGYAPRYYSSGYYG